VISFPIFFIAFDTFEIVDCTVCRGVVETLGGGIVVVIGEGVDILGGAVKIVVLLCWNDGSTPFPDIVGRDGIEEADLPNILILLDWNEGSMVAIVD